MAARNGIDNLIADVIVKPMEHDMDREEDVVVLNSVVGYNKCAIRTLGENPNSFIVVF